jgi:hypothetical protein
MTSLVFALSAEQRGRAVPIVVMRAALHLAGPHRQERLRAVQRLDLWLFIDAEDRRVLRRSRPARP